MSICGYTNHLTVPYYLLLRIYIAYFHLTHSHLKKNWPIFSEDTFKLSWSVASNSWPLNLATHNSSKCAHHLAMTYPSKWTGTSWVVSHTGHHCKPTRAGRFTTGRLMPGTGVQISFCVKTQEHVFMQWQYSKCQLWANCFMSWYGFRLMTSESQTPLTTHSGGQHAYHSAMAYLSRTDYSSST